MNNAKLISYSLASAFYLGKNHLITAQIIYTDFEPDITLATQADNYVLDIDNDGVSEFTFDAFYLHNYFGTYSYGGSFTCTTSGVSVILGNGCQLAGESDGHGSHGVPYMLDSGILVSESMNWVPDKKQPLEIIKRGDCNYGEGFWGDDDPKFLPVKFYLDYRTYYGWMRLMVDDDFSLTVFDFAYYAIPRGAIYTGDTGSEAAEINAFQQGSELVVILPEYMVSGKCEIFIYNNIGQVEFEESFSDTAQPHIDISGLKFGVYFLSARNEEVTRNAKWILRK